MISAREATIRPYRPGDEVAIQEAFAEVFGKQRSVAEWRWKFLETPRGARVLLAFDPEGRLICQYAGLGVEVTWHGERLVAGQMVDALSRGRAALGRRGSPFLLTLETFVASYCGVDGLSFIYGFAGWRHQRLGELAGVYNQAAEVGRLSRELVPAGRERSWAIRIVEGYDAHALARLWRRSEPRYPAAVVRDDRWFAWRYAARPGYAYDQIGVARGGEVRAWAVLAVREQQALWVDLVWDGASATDLAALAAAVEERSLAAGADRLELWLHGDPEARELLVSRGYRADVDPERRIGAITRDPRVSLDEILRGFYLTLGDSDHV